MVTETMETIKTLLLVLGVIVKYFHRMCMVIDSIIQIILLP